MKRFWLAVTATFCVAANVSWADVAPRIWAYQYVFATASAPHQFEPLLRHLKQEPELQTPELLDYVAQALVSPVNEDLDMQSEKLLARSLEKRGGARYRDTFALLVDKAHSNDIHLLAKSMVRKYRKRTETQFRPGSINFARLRENYAAAALAASNPTDEQAQRLAAFPTEASIDDLFALAGKPHAVISGQVFVTDLIIRVRVQRMGFIYRGIGRVTFEYTDGIGWKSRSVVTDPTALEGLLPYRYPVVLAGQPSNEELAYTQLLSGHLASMKMALETQWRSGKVSPEFVDTTAELLLKGHAKAEGSFAIDVHAWMCRVLVTYGGPRHASVLQSVAATTQNPKLRKYALLPQEKTGNPNTAPYVEGSVSLEALRARYPQPYPQRQFTSGQI